MNIKEAQEIHTEAIKRKDHRKIIELLEFYNAHLNVDPDNIAYLFLVATCHLQLGNNGIAINLLNKVVEKQPDLPEAWNNLGSAWKCEHVNDKAIEAFIEATKLKEDPDFYNNLATLHINEDDPAPGLGYAERAIELDGVSASASARRDESLKVIHLADVSRFVLDLQISAASDRFTVHVQAG